jgi:hypothetical protein
MLDHQGCAVKCYRLHTSFCSFYQLCIETIQNSVLGFNVIAKFRFHLQAEYMMLYCKIRENKLKPCVHKQW